MYVCVFDFLLPSDWMSWGSKHSYIFCFPSLKYNLQIYLNFNKLVIIYLINKKYKDFNIWTYIIHNCRTIMLVSWFSDARSNKSDITKEWTLSLTQPHKTGSIRWGLHPFIYYEMSLSLVDVGSPTHPLTPRVIDRSLCVGLYIMGGPIAAQ